MALVSYSDSEGSDSETKPATQSISKSSPNPGKPSFQKVVDRSNPHKIRVNLPEPSKSAAEEEGEEQGPSQKKAKVGPGAFSGFNSLLPAPKRNTATDGRLTGGLSRGISLKTGATPGFSREPMPTPDSSNDEKTGGLELADAGVRDDSSYPAFSDEQTSRGEVKGQEAPKRGNNVMFKPLSVARKPKKKKVIPVDSPSIEGRTGSMSNKTTKPVQKAFLFSAGNGQDLQDESLAVHGEYRPMHYESASATVIENQTSKNGGNSYTSYTDEGEDDSTITDNDPQIPNKAIKTLQSLDTIAADLNLSPSAKRQLFGRNKTNQSAINLVNFDTDREYAANDMLRQAGEQAQHNPVRAIAPGKHSLKQLVNAASSQKDALEEHFASGRRNKKEAGSKYGW